MAEDPIARVLRNVVEFGERKSALAALVKTDPKGDSGLAAAAWLSYRHQNHRPAAEDADYAETLALADKAIAKNPNLASAHWLRGLARQAIDRKKKASAAADFDRAIALDETFADALLSRAALFSDLGDDARRVPDLMKATRLAGARAFVAIERGGDHAQQGCFELQVTPVPADYDARQRSDHLVECAGALRCHEQYAASVDAFTRAIDANKDSSNAFAYAERATAHIALGQHDKAVADLARVLKSSPDDDSALLWLAHAHAAANKLADALQTYDRVLSLKKLGTWMETLARLGRAAVLERLGQSADAAAEDARVRALYGIREGAPAKLASADVAAAFSALLGVPLETSGTFAYVEWHDALGGDGFRRPKSDGSLLGALRAATAIAGGLKPLDPKVVVDTRWRPALERIAHPALRAHLSMFFLDAKSARSTGAFCRGDSCPSALRPFLADGWRCVLAWDFGEGQASAGVFALPLTAKKKTPAKKAAAKKAAPKKAAKKRA